MKSGDLVRLKPAYEHALKLKLGEAYLVVRFDGKYWTLMDGYGKEIKVADDVEFVFDVVSEVRNCLNDYTGHLNR